MNLSFENSLIPLDLSILPQNIIVPIFPQNIIITFQTLEYLCQIFAITLLAHSLDNMLLA